jgi:hypothetical protein
VACCCGAPTLLPPLPLPLVLLAVLAPLLALLRCKVLTASIRAKLPRKPQVALWQRQLAAWSLLMSTPKLSSPMVPPWQEGHSVRYQWSYTILSPMSMS